MLCTMYAQHSLLVDRICMIILLDPTCCLPLCLQDYRWWWRSFFTSGSSAVYVFLYSVLYFFTRLEIIDFVSALLFFTYMFIVSLLFFLLTGTIGFWACFLFVRKIYGSLKID